ncbi:penicillin-binding protein 1B [Sediminicurvatus halobius]|uniref:Penicillin-binding protein 1B n=1 Tax=Sediminicurvatus halobius TaxID=2182432 RepID=A0A2U2N5T1_9GAMM|nr:penicillin-binding protein 1B [Spiribacter halobius]PWG64344.1 penicillin-binding protein 1B [Spiribacter halobius]UEX79310.1 penicillin-binding protein 1B [Spiribacter halobius]
MARRRAANGKRKPRRRQGRWHLRRWLLGVVVLGVLVSAAHVAWLDHRVSTEFEGKRWAVPARVYARPLELHVGRPLDAQTLLAELRAAGYRPVERLQGPGQYTRSGQRFGIHTRAFRFWDGREPAQRLELQLADGHVATLHDPRSGAGVDLARLDPAPIGGLYPAHREDRILVQLEEVPRPLVEALLAVEDRGFPDHFGISPTGIARALVANLQAGRIVQGGSTLTQQLVKNFFLNADRTLWRKANEAVMAVLLELRYSKAEILEAYLNEVYLGQAPSRAIHGFGLASRFYFGEPLERLDVAEQALLVGMVKGPSHYNPRRHPERARARRDLVLDRMVAVGYLSPAEARAARAAPLGVIEEGGGAGRDYPAFLDLVRRHLQRDYRAEDLTSEGLRIFTTLAPATQEQAEAAIIRRTAELGSDVQAAAVVVDTDDGEVRALVGGREPRFEGFNRALDASRPVGSLIKPAVYLAALERSDAYGLGTRLEDRPVTLQNESGQEWRPQNYDGEFRGDVALWEALAHSYNVPTVRLGLDVGLRATVDVMRRLGLRVPDTVYPSLLLGAVEQTPIDIARAYTTLASGGYRMPLRSVRAVTTAEGEALNRYPLSVERAFAPEPVFLVNHALRRAVTEGTARGLGRWLPADGSIAGKTGTTDDNRDSWFAGYRGDTLAVVWAGRDDGGDTGLTGSSGAMTVWGEMMAGVPVRRSPPRPPEGIEVVWIDPASGRRAAAYCEGAVQLPYVEGAAPGAAAPCVEESNVVDRAAGWFRRWLD